MLVIIILALVGRKIINWLHRGWKLNWFYLLIIRLFAINLITFVHKGIVGLVWCFDFLTVVLLHLTSEILKGQPLHSIVRFNFLLRHFGWGLRVENRFSWGKVWFDSRSFISLIIANCYLLPILVQGRLLLARPGKRIRCRTQIHLAELSSALSQLQLAAFNLLFLC